MTMPSEFPIEDVRRQFPALEQARGEPFVFFDNAAGAQVPARVVSAVADHLVARNVQRGGPYRRSREVDDMIARTRERLTAFVNARSADEIAFGLNATSFVRTISAAVGRTLGTRTEVVVTELDHEANIAPWLDLERAGARIVWWRVREDGRLRPDDLDSLLTERTRIVACTLASNATGSLVDVGAAVRRAHEVGAEVLVDAVHYAPHGPIDVQALDCDYLVCSAYKIFAPHLGFAWCRREAINRLPTFREHFIPDTTPDKLEAGTFAYEGVAGLAAALEYLEDLGPGRPGGSGATWQGERRKEEEERRTETQNPEPRSLNPEPGRREALRASMTAIAEYERTLSGELLSAVTSIPGSDVVVHGITDRTHLDQRVPTLCFSIPGVDPAEVASSLAAHGIGLRSGHMYSPRLMARLGVMPAGVIRASLVHYNTTAEIVRFRAALADVVSALTK